MRKEIGGMREGRQCRRERMRKTRIRPLISLSVDKERTRKSVVEMCKSDAVQACQP